MFTFSEFNNINNFQISSIPMFSDYIFFFPEIILLSCLFFIILQFSLQKTTSITVLTPLLVINKLIKVLFITIFFLVINPYSWIFSSTVFFDFFIINSQITYIKILILLLCILILKSNFFYIFIEKIANNDFFVFFGFLIFFLLIFLHINDFFVLFLIFEIISILLYLLILYVKKFFFISVKIKKKNLTKYQFFLLQYSLKSNYLTLNIFSSIIYFLLNVFISSGFLFGLFLMFLIYQTTNFFFLLNFLNNYFFFLEYSNLIFIIFFFFLCMFFFKLSIVPFHWWISAVFESSSILFLMFLAIPIKIIFLIFFCKIFIYFFCILIFKFQNFINFFAILSMIVGTLGLFHQVKLKKFWAYSTINHMGYFLISLNSLCFLGLRTFFIYLIFYVLINILFFLILQCLFIETINQRLYYIHQLNIIYLNQLNWLLFIFTILIFSLIGIPPSLGFWSKYLVISCIILKMSNFWIILLLLIIIITTILSTFCYLRIWKTLFLEDYTAIVKNKIMPMPIFHCVILLIFTGFFIFCSLNLFFKTSIIIKVLDDFISFYLLLKF